MVLAGATLLVLFALAFANGANDVSKGIATLVGSGMTRYRTALLWGSVCTAMGGSLAVVVSSALVQTFAHGFLSADPAASVSFAVAVACGAFGWVAFASATGLPVSTTHAIVGSLLGIALAAYGPGRILWGSVGLKVVLPLLLSPFLALGLTWVLSFVLRPVLGKGRELCLCVGIRDWAMQPAGSGAGDEIILRSSPVPGAVVGEREDCIRYVPTFLRIDMDVLHWVSSGATGVARGMNDAPKIVALSAPLWLAGAGMAGRSLTALYFGVTAAMTLGSFLGGLRVTRTLAERVTTMSPGEGFTANLCTSLMVAVASRFGLPVSTTHISSMAIVGVGVRRGFSAVSWGTVGEMVLAWVLTLPAAGIIGIAAWWATEVWG